MYKVVVKINNGEKWVHWFSTMNEATTYIYAIDELGSAIPQNYVQYIKLNGKKVHNYEN